KGKLNRDSQRQWVSRLIFLLKPIFGKQSALVIMLEQLRKVEHFVSSFKASADAGSFVAASRRSLIPATNDVFVVHGRDETNQLRVSKLIREDFKLTPIVLLDKPGRSAPTIDKFEHHAQTCSYAIALFTADDRVITKRGEEYWQPRPNV